MSKKKINKRQETDAAQDQQKDPKSTIVEEGKEQELMVQVSKKELDHLKQEAKDFKDKYLRTLADSENARKRLQNERQDIFKHARESIIVEFLYPLDHFENAVGFSQNMSEEVKNWAKGFEMILTQFKDVLSQNGVKAMESEGKLFDPHFHEAVESVETDENPPGIIVKEFVRGYQMGDRTIRPARVKVTKSPSQSNKESSGEEEIVNKETKETIN